MQRVVRLDYQGAVEPRTDEPRVEKSREEKIRESQEKILAKYAETFRRLAE